MITSSSLQLELGKPRIWVGATAGFAQPVIGVPLKISVPPLLSDAAARTKLERALAAALAGFPDTPWQVAATPCELPLLLVRLACWLQQSADHPVACGRVVPGTGLVRQLLVPCHHAGTASAAVKLALGIIAHLLAQQFGVNVPPAQTLDPANVLPNFLQRARKQGLLPNTLAFIAAAQRRNMPWLHLGHGIVQIGYGAQSRRLDSSFTDQTGNLGVRLARNKVQASELMRQMALPMPAQRLARTADEAVTAAQALQFPVAVKPAAQDQGKGVAAGLQDAAAVRKAFAAAAKFGTPVLVEQHIHGDDYRILVAQGEMLSAIRRVPGGVTGDARQTVAELVTEANRDPRRGTGKGALVLLALDDEAQDMLAEQGLQANSVPAAGRVVRLRRTANLSTGGVPESVTAIIHPDNRALAERAARVVGLDIAGVDFLCPDITRSWREVGGGICEVNAQPGFRPHWFGEPDGDINGRVLEKLVTGDGRIPVAAVSGTNGKTTVCQMLHHILLAAGLRSGVSTTQGVWVGEQLVSDLHLSGHPGGRLLLTDPLVEAAVIEMPRKGLLNLGFPFDLCDVATVTNVQDDHLGRDGIASLLQMAKLKSTVMERARKAVVVNADDKLCLQMGAAAKAPRKIFVSAQATLPAALLAHVAAGGEAVVFDHALAALVLLAGTRRASLMPVADIPATAGGQLGVNIANALQAAALALGMQLPPARIRAGLAAFTSSVESNPGRFNDIAGFPFRVLLDFAHNPDGIKAVCDYVRGIPCSGRKRLISYSGGRHRQAIVDWSADLAASFDNFTIGLYEKGVNANPEWDSLGYAGAVQFAGQQLQAHGVAADAITLAPDDARGIASGLADAQAGDLVVILHSPQRALPCIRAALPAAAPATRRAA